MDDIPGRIAAIKAEIDAIATRAGRRDSVQLVAVTKTVTIDRVRAALAAGQTHFGENRVKEGGVKARELPEATWHLIGHLQTNKVAAAVQSFSVIESVDSIRLAARLSAASGTRGDPLQVFLEVNVAGEASKEGFTVEGCLSGMPNLLELPNLQVRGLMTVAPLTQNPDDIRWVFRSLRELWDQIRLRFEPRYFDQLSMGMSNDFKVAIEEGATMVRLGRAIFGERPALTEG